MTERVEYYTPVLDAAALPKVTKVATTVKERGGGASAEWWDWWWDFAPFGPERTACDVR